MRPRQGRRKNGSRRRTGCEIVGILRVSTDVANLSHDVESTLQDVGSSTWIRVRVNEHTQ